MMKEMNEHKINPKMENINNHNQNQNNINNNNNNNNTNNEHALQMQLMAMQRRLENAMHMSEAHQTFSKAAEMREMESKKKAEITEKRLKITSELLQAVSEKEQMMQLEESSLSKHSQIHKMENGIRELYTDPNLSMPVNTWKRKKLIAKKKKLKSLKIDVHSQTILLEHLKIKQAMHEDIRNAANNGDIEKVSQLIVDGAGVNIPDDFGFTAFEYACRCGHIEVVETMIKMAYPDIHGEHSKSIPLLIAVKNKNLEIIDLLLKNNVDIEKADDTGKTALLEACEYPSSYSCICQLIDEGADLNTKDGHGNTCLHISLCSANKSKDKHDYDKIIKLLLESGADINITNAKGFTALQLAYVKGCQSMIKMLKDHEYTNTT